MARAIAVEIVGDASSVQRAFGKASVSAKNFDRSLSKTTRGAIAGSGIFRGLGRSLAFASGGFLAFEGITSTISNSIKGAESLEKAERGLSAAIQHTGGNLAKLKPQYENVAKGAARFGINQADATTALERATVLTGNAVKAQRAYQEALVISKATGKDFNAVLTATAKGQEGVTTSLQRYGILIAKGTPGQQQFNTVMARFAGQAKANTSAIDRFNATWQNTEEILGAALLPTLNRILTKFSAWLTKMQQSGQLQRDVNKAVRDATHVFHALESVIRAVDKVTGGFKNTLEILLAFKVASIIARWADSFRLLGASAATAEGEVGGLRGAMIALGGAEVLGPLAAVTAAVVAIGIASRNTDKYIKDAKRDASGFPIITDQNTGVTSIATPRGLLRTTDPNAGNFGGGTGGPHHHRHRGPVAPKGAFDNSTPATDSPGTIKKFTLPYELQLRQSRAALTKGLADDIAVEKSIVAYIKHLLATRKLSKQARLDAINAESSALQTLWADENSIAAKRAAAAKKAAAKAATFAAPAKLELALARDQALGLSQTKDLLKLRSLILKFIATHKKNTKALIDAYNQLAQVNDELGSSATSALGAFKQASTRKLTAGLGLSAAQRKALRARLSQLGPGGTVPGDGTGAFGFVIGKDGHVKGSKSATRAAGRRGPITNADLGHLIRRLDRLADRPVRVIVDLDGRVIADSTTRHQQRRRRRNPTQRRGPNAATR